MASLDNAEFRKRFKKPIIKTVDMLQENSQEVMEIVTMALDKWMSQKKYEEAAKMVKQNLDKKFGGFFHVVVGEGFSFEITYQYRHMLHMYYGENVGVLVFKC